MVQLTWFPVEAAQFGAARKSALPPRLTTDGGVMAVSHCTKFGSHSGSVAGLHCERESGRRPCIWPAAPWNAETAVFAKGAAKGSTGVVTDTPPPHWFEAYVAPKMFWRAGMTSRAMRAATGASTAARTSGAVSTTVWSFETAFVALSTTAVRTLAPATLWHST